MGRVSSEWQASEKLNWQRVNGDPMTIGCRNLMQMVLRLRIYAEPRGTDRVDGSTSSGPWRSAEHVVRSHTAVSDKVRLATV